MLKALDIAYGLYENILQRDVKSSWRIEHVAIIQDGNRRYAKSKGIPQKEGHSLGALTTERVCDWCVEIGIKHLTVYAFSTENFHRDEDEKSYLFDIIGNKLDELRTSEKIHKNKVRVRSIGRVEMLPLKLQRSISRVEAATKHYDGLFLNVALAYGGQCELADAARKLGKLIKEGKFKAKDLNEEIISRYLYPFDGIPVPKVDLIIRTGGENRTSNFLPWQANGNECAAYFCAPYWPEFRKIDFLRALRTAQMRMPMIRSTGL